jgi:hypothetical protein
LNERLRDTPLSQSDGRIGFPDENANDAEEDRRLSELMQEFRLVLPAATVLFAFLLSVPFASRFEQLSSLDRVVYYVAVASSAGALTFLMGEAGYHQLRGRPYDKSIMIRTTSRQAVVALGLLGVSLVACVVLVSVFVYGSVIAFWVTLPLGVCTLGMWFALPLVRRWRGDPS